MGYAVLFMAVENNRILDSNSRMGSQSGKAHDGKNGVLRVWQNLRSHLPLGAHGEEGKEESTASPISGIGKEAVVDGRHIIADILPHGLNDENPITYDDIGTVMEWAQHPSVKGHIYQLESGPEDLYGNRWATYLEYYRGVRDDEGKKTEPKNCAFFKAVNGRGQMLAVATMRWRDVEFVKPGRTAYWERLIVDPDLQGRKIGLAFGIDMLDTAFYRYDGYDGRPARGVRGSTYVDREAQGFDRNELFLRMLGFEKHGDAIPVGNRLVQPWRLTLSAYEATRPDALRRLLDEQPQRREYLEEAGAKFQQQ